ncbi:MAG TPA: SOS response-associated peptidase [Anaerolineae bacterium]|nr:SOS response-associated peptidase [Anaerolineae bacterium]
MCGRFTITLEPAIWQQEFDLNSVPSEWKPRYNVAPTQPVPVVMDADLRDVKMLRWGLIPFWSKDESIGSRLINARSETLQEKPSFRNAFKQRRCLILTDGFYEWQRSSKHGVPKVPYYFKMKSGKTFAFAGLWENWRTPDEQEMCSCAIITCPPNTLVAPIHNRMPVLFDSRNCWAWLKETNLIKLKSLLLPYPAEKMRTYPVGRLINNPKVDKPECVLPLAF